MFHKMSICLLNRNSDTKPQLCFMKKIHTTKYTCELPGHRRQVMKTSKVSKEYIQKRIYSTHIYLEYRRQ